MQAKLYRSSRPIPKVKSAFIQPFSNLERILQREECMYVHVAVLALSVHVALRMILSLTLLYVRDHPKIQTIDTKISLQQDRQAWLQILHTKSQQAKRYD